MHYMKKLIILLFPLIVFSASPFDTPLEISYDLSVFDTKRTKSNTKAMENSKIICREVCDKKLYKEQKIAEAISFYKKKNIK